LFVRCIGLLFSDATIEVLIKQALSHAKAWADGVLSYYAVEVARWLKA
jgi:delta-aminolevulinic acid dehydratase/porphobilinogen synthase